jgi:hypothetical protein
VDLETDIKSLRSKNNILSQQMEETKTEMSTKTIKLNVLPYKPTGPVSSNIYRPTINSTGPNLKTTLMTINSNHRNSKDDDVL